MTKQTNLHDPLKESGMFYINHETATSLSARSFLCGATYTDLTCQKSRRLEASLKGFRERNQWYTSHQKGRAYGYGNTNHTCSKIGTKQHGSYYLLSQDWVTCLSPTQSPGGALWRVFRPVPWNIRLAVTAQETLCRHIKRMPSMTDWSPHSVHHRHRM